MKPASGAFREPSYEAHRLTDAVSALSRAPLDPSYRAEAAALGALAECVRDLSRADIAPARVRSAAARVTASETTETARVEAVSDALAAAGAVLTTKRSGSRSEEHETLSLAYEAAFTRLDGGSSLLEQRGNLVAALRAATNLVYLAQEARRPFPPDQVLRAWKEPASFCDALEQARQRVRALAGATSQDAQAGAADVLFALADVMAREPRAAARRAELSAIRLEAFGLRHRRSFDGARGVKVALDRTLDILESIWREPELEPWIQMARRSVDAIGEGVVVFEHAAIQDAARTVLSVVVRHAAVTGSCPAFVATPQ